MSLSTKISEIEMKKIPEKVVKTFKEVKSKSTKPPKTLKPPVRHPRKKREFREMLPELGLDNLDKCFDYKLVTDTLSNLNLIKESSEEGPDIYSLPLDEFLSEKRQFFLDTFPIGEIYENK